MEIQSENIKKYLLNNLDIPDEDNIDIKDIYKIENININRLNYKLEEAKFFPEELAYFKELKECSLSGFLITDDIKKNLSKLEKLKTISFDHCIYSGNEKIKNKMKNINLNCSNYNLAYMFDKKNYTEKILLKDVIEVDINRICEFINLRELILLNCDIKNSNLLISLKSLKKLKIIGCKLDNYDIISKIEFK